MLSPRLCHHFTDARTFSFFYELLTIIGCEHEHSCTRSIRCDFSGDFQSVHAWHRERSRTTTSGFSSRTISSATLPFSASPQTCQLVFVSMQDRTASRIAWLSSTTRIRSGILLRTPFRDLKGIHLRVGIWPEEINSSPNTT
jgi:hypothetical protein